VRAYSRAAVDDECEDGNKFDNRIHCAIERIQSEIGSDDLSAVLFLHPEQPDPGSD
jgi:hypothetical protein